MTAKTFFQVALDIENRQEQVGTFPRPDVVIEQTAREILDGFHTSGGLDLGWAEENLETMHETGNVFFTIWGYEVGAQALEQAIHYAKAHHKDHEPFQV